jgi:hypothetical protein
MLADLATPDLAILNAAPEGPTRLSALRGSPVVLTFRPITWDPARPEHLGLFTRLLSRFLGPGEALDGATHDGIWCHLHLEGRKARVGLVTPSNPITVRGANGESPGVVVLLDAAGRVRWRYFPPSGGTMPSEEILGALADLAPVPGSPGQALTREEFYGATLAATIILSTRPNAGRASYRSVVPALVYR